MSVRTCIQVKTNGAQCGSPALRNSTHCYFHHRHRRTLKRRMIFSSLSTPKARAQALSKIVDAVLADRIDPEVARTLIYGIQAAQGLS